MPSSTRPASLGPSSVPQGSKRAMSDPESTPHDSKKARTVPSAEPSSRRDSNRDARRRRRRKKKAPIVTAGVPKDGAPLPQLDGPSRTPLSARNEIIRFTSAPPETDQPASAIPDPKTSSHTPSSKQLCNTQATDHSSEHHRESMPPIPKENAWTAPMDAPVTEPSSSSLQDKIAQLEAELKSKNTLIASHHALLNQVQQAVTCQVCLDLMYKAYALAPCGHLACHSCLVSWFTAPPSDNRQIPPAIMRRKTCPHCRAVVRERPVEVWGVKSIAHAVGKSGLIPNQLPVPDEAPEGLNANPDPWKDIFPKSGVASQRGFPWFFPNDDSDDDDIRVGNVHVGDVAPRGEDVGMLDMEDGGIYRCLDCMHEIWDGICSSCGRVYPGHRPEGDHEDLDENAMGWLEDQMGAEEVNVADDPGWMGLEDGEADDDGGDIDDWRPFDPWRHQIHMFRGHWGFLGTIHVDEDEDESGDEGYESSFIDDGDERVGVATFSDEPRFYEIGDNEDEDYRAHRDPASDDGEEDEGFNPPAERRPTSIFASSDEDDEYEDGAMAGRRQRREIVESDASECSF